MTELRLEQLCRDVYHTVFGKKINKINARFYSSRSLRHSIHVKRGIIQVKIADSMRDAPEPILKALCTILLLKLFKIKVDRRLYKIYREYLDENPSLLKTIQKRPPSQRYTPKGHYFNLTEIFNEINRQYFEGRLQLPVLGWSLRKAYRRLGFYNQEKNLLVISRIFDSKKVPRNVIEYLMYHEMLHIAIPIKKVNSRRQVHSSEFKRLEKSFPQYEEIQKWLNKNLGKL